MFGVLRPGSPRRERVLQASSSPPPARSLAPMPDSDFPTRDELLAATKDWASDQGYAVVIARSRFNRLWLKCDRGGKYENRRNLTEDQRKRKRGESRLLGCPFKMIASAKKDGLWHLETENGEHNHEPSDDLTQHPTLRRMTDEQLQKVHDMCDAGNTPSETIEELRKIWSDIKILTRDIYNARKKYKTQKELAEAAGGIPSSQAYTDPNGIIPGPDTQGRWAWIHDGDEILTKGKKRRKLPPRPHPALDPQLQMRRRQSHDENGLATGNSHSYEQMENNTESPSTPGYGSNDAGPSQMGSWTDPTQINVSQTSAPLLREREPTQSTATHNNVLNGLSSSPHITTPAVGGTQRSSGGDLLETRLQSIEKDQHETRNMLSKILGAVQGMNGSPSPSSHLP